MKAFIGIGSNIGDRLENCFKAISMIDNINNCIVLKRSSFYKTEPVGYRDQDWFVNCIILIDTALSPHGLLKELKNIERLMGRQGGIRWGPRVIDLDIIMYEDLIMDDDELTIPHPMMHKRRFVLVPMNQIAPYVIHPAFNRTIRFSVAGL